MTGEAIGWGAEFHLHDGTALVKLAGVTSVTPPELSTDEHEVTDFDVANKTKTFIRGLIDPGEIQVELNYVGGSATDALLLAAQAAGDVRAWKMVLPDSTGTALRQLTGNGYVSTYKINQVEPNAPMTATLTIRVSGAVTEGAAV